VALVLPFRGVRLDPRRSDLAALLCPPYDIIDQAMRSRLAAHAESLVHLELPCDGAGPGTRYAAAASRLAEWMERGVLRRDAEPSLYAYAQRFSWDGGTRERRSVFGLLALSPPGAASRLHPHEATLAAPREDRRRLLEATGANTSPVFLLAEDPAGVVAQELARATAGTPLATATTPWGTEERLWRWSGEGARRAAGALAESQLVFADGHHRFASAREHAARDRGESAAFVLAAITPISDPGLLVLPTHRLLPAATVPLAALRPLLAEHFDETAIEAPGAVAGRARAAHGWLAQAERGGGVAFVLAAPEGLRGHTLRPERGEALYAGIGIDPRLAGLPVSALQALLARALGKPVDEVAASAGIGYAHDAAEALARAEEARASAVLLPPVPVAEILRVAAAGLLLPQKSTYFLPKLTTGWLLHVHEREGEAWRGSPWSAPYRTVAREWLGPHGVPAEAAG
jgi:uncharacterized protein (DUF1015 family)